MKLYLVLTGNGISNYIVAMDKDDALKYFKDYHVMDIVELDLSFSVDAINCIHNK